MKVLITGAAGFLGRRLTRALLAANTTISDVSRIIAVDTTMSPIDDLRVDWRVGTVTDADFVAYVDTPVLFPIDSLPPTHSFVGPPLWEPTVPLPAWWGDLRQDRPLVYVTLGSSGQASLLPAVVHALCSLEASIVIATAARARLPALPPNAYSADFLPGVQVARQADVVVCNGGSLTSYQALSGGTPVIGVASNLDQFLNMQAVEGIGAGVTLRADRFRPAELVGAARRVLATPTFETSARRVADWCSEHPFAPAIRRVLQDIAQARGTRH